MVTSAVLSPSPWPSLVAGACPISAAVDTPALPEVEPAASPSAPAPDVADVADVGDAVAGSVEDGEEAVELPSVLGVALVLVLVPASTAELLSVDVLVVEDGSDADVEGAEGDGGDVDEEEGAAALLLLGALVLVLGLLVDSEAEEALLGVVLLLLLLAAPVQARRGHSKHADVDADADADSGVDERGEEEWAKTCSGSRDP